jgi:hypothetical protein
MQESGSEWFTLYRSQAKMVGSSRYTRPLTVLRLQGIRNELLRSAQLLSAQLPYSEQCIGHMHEAEAVHQLHALLMTAGSSRKDTRLVSTFFTWSLYS